MGSRSKNRENKPKRSHENPNLTDKMIITDSRFASIHSDPRFQRVPKHKSKVVIDSRFSLRLSDKLFAPSSAPVDKRGKRRKKTGANALSRFYRFEGERGEERESGSESGEEERGGGGDVVKRAVDESEDEDEEREDEESEEERDESESSTDSDDDDEEEDEDIYEEEGNLVQEESIPSIEKETHRLAVVNMDWRCVKAVDLYVMLSSFLPKDGQISSVAVYPSEFGLQRMKEEEVHGPVGLFNGEKDGSGDDGDDEIDSEELRAYEKSRLKYYFAVVECDSVATADYLYNACDGVEFERSANVLDLRFIPDSMEFKHPPRDVATEAPANYEGLDFQTRALQQSKIHLTWEEDEPERVKTLKRKFNEDQLAELELKEFLASDESESDDNDGDEDNKNTSEYPQDKKQRKRDAYRALLEGGGDSDGGDSDEKKDMEVTFITGLEDLNKRILEKKDQKSETVWETYLRKRREKKKARKSKQKKSSDDESSNESDPGEVEEPGDFFLEEEPPVKSSKMHGKTKKSKKDQKGKSEEEEASRAVLELLLADENGADNSLKGYNLKRKKAKGKKGKEALDEDKIPAIDCEDPRFSTVFTNPDFALDPTDPQFKRSAVYARQVAVKHQKGDAADKLENKPKKLPVDDQPLDGDMETQNADLVNMETQHADLVKSDLSSSSKEKFELSLLVRSLKMKSKQVQVPSSSNVKEKRRKRAK